MCLYVSVPPVKGQMHDDHTYIWCLMITDEFLDLNRKKYSFLYIGFFSALLHCYETLSCHNDEINDNKDMKYQMFHAKNALTQRLTRAHLLYIIYNMMACYVWHDTQSIYDYGHLSLSLILTPVHHVQKQKFNSSLTSSTQRVGHAPSHSVYEVVNSEDISIQIVVLWIVNTD